MDGFRDASTDLLFDLARPSRHDIVLDYACGVGMAALALAAEVDRCEAVDDQPDALDEGRRLGAELGGRDRLPRSPTSPRSPFADGAFSLVVSQDALHRLPTLWRRSPRWGA